MKNKKIINFLIMIEYTNKMNNNNLKYKNNNNIIYYSQKK